MVPLLDINRQTLELEPELNTAFQRVLRSGQFVLGPEVTALEEEIAKLSGVKHALGTSSGTDALLLALMALDIGPGDEVLCPAFTFFATAGCVARVGATPVFVDINAVTFNIDVDDALRKITSQSKAIIPVHLYGQCADMDRVMELASANKLAVIEDAAQSLGASFRGRAAGSFGVFTAFSFYPTKNLGGLGDGGMLACNDSDLANKARALRNHGSYETYHHHFVGGNFRLDAMQAGFLRTKLGKLGSYNGRRRANAACYTEKLSKLPRTALGTDHPDTETTIVLPAVDPRCDHIWNQYTVRVRGDRDAFKRFLLDRGIQTGIYYPKPLHQQECFAQLRQQKSCPVADQLSEEVVSLPIFPELLEDERAQVIEAIAAYCDGTDGAQ